jgi:DNA-binding GntR family transcriptional regulator
LTWGTLLLSTIRHRTGGFTIASQAQVGDKAPPIADRIAQRLVRDIMRGRYRPGDRIREQEVADRLGVSRGPVREALHIVEQDGLIENVPWKGARVVLLTLDDLEDLFRLTSAIMEVVAGLAIRRATDQELAEFARRVEAHAPTADPSRPIQEQLNAAFGLGAYLFQIARSPRVTAAISRVVRLVYWQHRVLNAVDAAWRAEAVETWRELARVLPGRDATRARRAVNAVDRHTRQKVLRIHRELGSAVYRLFD